MRLSAQVTQSGTVLERVDFKLKRTGDLKRAVGKVVNRFRKGGGQLFAEDTTIAVVKKGAEAKAKAEIKTKSKTKTKTEAKAKTEAKTKAKTKTQPRQPKSAPATSI